MIKGQEDLHVFLFIFDKTVVIIFFMCDIFWLSQQKFATTVVHRTPANLQQEEAKKGEWKRIAKRGEGEWRIIIIN